MKIDRFGDLQLGPSFCKDNFLSNIEFVWYYFPHFSRWLRIERNHIKSILYSNQKCWNVKIKITTILEQNIIHFAYYSFSIKNKKNLWTSSLSHYVLCFIPGENVPLSKQHQSWHDVSSRSSDCVTKVAKYRHHTSSVYFQPKVIIIV